jgi:hypothetical protein
MMPDPIDISGFALLEGNKQFILPDKTNIKGHGTKKIYFFSIRHRQDAEAMRKKGNEVICDTFGLSSGEIVRLINSAGETLDIKQAQ